MLLALPPLPHLILAIFGDSNMIIADDRSIRE